MREEVRRDFRRAQEPRLPEPSASRPGRRGKKSRRNDSTLRSKRTVRYTAEPRECCRFDRRAPDKSATEIGWELRGDHARRWRVARNGRRRRFLRLWRRVCDPRRARQNFCRASAARGNYLRAIPGNEFPALGESPPKRPGIRNSVSLFAETD